MRRRSHGSQDCDLTASEPQTAAQAGMHSSMPTGNSCEGGPGSGAQSSRSASPQDSMPGIATQPPAALAHQRAQKSSVVFSATHEGDDSASVTYDVCSLNEAGRAPEQPVRHSRSHSSGGSSYHSGHSSLRSIGTESENSAVIGCAARAAVTPRQMYVRPQSYAVQLQLQQQVWQCTSATVFSLFAGHQVDASLHTPRFP